VLPLLADQERTARGRLPAEVHRYYAGGADAEQTLAEAETAWERVRLVPRVLRDVGSVDTTLELLGTPLSTPVLAAPTAAHGLAHAGAETATAQGVGRAGSLLVLSCRSTAPPRAVGETGTPFWHQAYVYTERDLTWRQADDAVAAGARAVVLTGDVPWLGRRAGATRRQLVPASVGEQDPTAGLEMIGQLTGRTGLPVLVKGVLHPDDADACLSAGAAGIVVSNHGGRQLDRAVASADALPAVVAAVGGRAPVLVDGGLRSGLDVLCALSLGASAVLLGRPVLWALAAGGADGVTACLAAVREDLVHQMGLCGAARLADLR